MDHEYYESQHDWDERWKAYAQDYEDLCNRLSEESTIPTEEEIEAYLAKETQRAWLEESQLNNGQDIQMTKDDLLDTMLFISRLKGAKNEG